MQRWCCRDIDITQFRPTSSSPTPEQAAFARSYIAAAHAAGRLLRFWNTNDTPEVRAGSWGRTALTCRVVVLTQS